jgi:hypothetical protein
LGGLLIASSTPKAPLPITPFTDINAPGSLPGVTGSFGLGVNNRGRVARIRNDNSGDFDGFLYAGGKSVAVDASTLEYDVNGWARVIGRGDHDQT